MLFSEYQKEKLNKNINEQTKKLMQQNDISLTNLKHLHQKNTKFLWPEFCFILKDTFFVKINYTCSSYTS